MFNQYLKCSFVFCLLCTFFMIGFSESSDNRDQCSSNYEGIVCYPIDCCFKYVQCINGHIYPPQVYLFIVLLSIQNVAPGTNCKNREFVLVNECSNVNCPTELPDWGSGTGSGGSGGSGGSSGSGDSSGDNENAGEDSATGQFRLKTTNHGK